MKHIFTLLLVAAGFLHSASAQTIITFEQREQKSSSFSGPNGQNAVTLGLISSFNGYLPVYYERRLLDILTVEAGIGPTFRSLGNDLGALIYDNGYESKTFGTYDVFGNSYTSDIYDQYWNYDARKSRLGLMVSFAPKIYPGGYALDGFHLGPVVEYKAFRYEARLADESLIGYNGTALPTNEDQIPRSTATLNEHMNCLDLTIQLGGMYQAPSHVTIGWGFSFGVRSLNAERLDVGTYFNSVTGESRYGNATNSFNSIRPICLFDLKLGGWF